MPPQSTQLAQGRTLDALLEGGNLGALQRMNQQTAQNVGQSVPSSQAFGMALMNLLKQYQQLGTKPFQEQAIAGQEAQTNRIFRTPSDLIGASPELQAGVRGAAVQALQPTVAGAQQAGQTFGEQLRSFGSAVEASRQFLADYETQQERVRQQQDRSRDDARSAIHSALSLVGGSAFDGLSAEEVAKFEKAAGYPKGYLQGISKTLKERELELKKQEPKYAAGAVGEYQFYAEQEKAAGRRPVSFQEYQNLDANRKKSIAAAGLSVTQRQSALDRVQDDYRQDPVIKKFNEAAAGWSQIRGIDVNTTNPADDISVIYAFAKIMDPESVVREGEYATIQKYAQSWAEKFGFNAARIFTNTKFLSSQALQNIRTTAQAKYQSLEKAYSSARKDYEQRISDIKGGALATTLPDYREAFAEQSPSSQSGQPKTGYKPGQVITKGTAQFKVNADGKSMTRIK